MEKDSNSGKQVVQLNWNLHQAQRQVFSNPARYKFLMAGRRFGKTRLMLYTMLKAAETPNSKIWYVAPFKNQAEEIAWVDFISLIPKEILLRYNETKLLIEFKNGSRIIFKGADKDNLRGPGLDFMGVDEAQDLRPGIWQTVLAPMLMGRNGKALLIGTKKNRNWFRDEWKRVNSKEVPQSDSFYFPCTVNSFITAEEWAMEKKRQSMTVWTNEFISDPMSNDVNDESRKYVEFDPKVHVVNPFKIPKEWKIYRGADWGMDHPTACLWAARNPSDGTVFIYDEYKRGGLSAALQAKILLQKTGNVEVASSVLDPQCWRNESDGLSIAARFRKEGLVFQPGNKEDKSGSGASTVKAYLKPSDGSKPKLQIFSTCSLLIAEIESLQWSDKTGDDLTDALRYLVVYLGRLPLESKTVKSDWYDKDLVRKLPNGQFEPILPPNTADDIAFTDSGFLS